MLSPPLIFWDQRPAVKHIVKQLFAPVMPRCLRIWLEWEPPYHNLHTPALTPRDFIQSQSSWNLLLQLKIYINLHVFIFEQMSIYECVCMPGKCCMVFQPSEHLSHIKVTSCLKASLEMLGFLVLLKCTVLLGCKDFWLHINFAVKCIEMISFQQLCPTQLSASFQVETSGLYAIFCHFTILQLKLLHGARAI